MADERTTVAEYIRQAALSRGIDPDTALRVFKQESGFNPHARNISDREESYGVAQLNVMGGLGAEARKLGIEPSDPAQWPKHVDFALDTVQRDGWRQWYGARDVGIGRWQGVGQPAGASSPQPVYSPPMSGTQQTEPAPDVASVFSSGVIPQLTFTRSSPPQINEQPEDPDLASIFQPRTSQRPRGKTRKGLS